MELCPESGAWTLYAICASTRAGPALSASSFSGESLETPCHHHPCFLILIRTRAIHTYAKRMNEDGLQRDMADLQLHHLHELVLRLSFRHSSQGHGGAVLLPAQVVEL